MRLKHCFVQCCLLSTILPSFSPVCPSHTGGGELNGMGEMSRESGGVVRNGGGLG